MKLTTLLVSAVLALGVAAVDPEAGNDVEVRDFSGESLNEFDARDEEELDARDEQDIEARTDYGPKCKGQNVKWTYANYKWSCVCTRTGEYYNPHSGCACKPGYEYSDKYSKCIVKCKGYEVYDDKTGKCEKPFYCKGQNVKISVDNYGTKSCQCLLTGQTYNELRGCECKDGEYFSKEHNKCIPKCSYGTVYNGHECAPVCKGDHVIYKHKECKCLKPGYYYDNTYGCKPRCDGDATWNGHECKCPYGKDYVKGKGCVSKCITPAYFKKGYCQCPSKDQEYDQVKGCVNRCDGDATWNGHECKCPYGKDYVKGKGCVSKCITPAYFKKGACQCPSKDQYYDQVKGCVNRCDGDGKWNGYKCECPYGKDYVKGKGCVSKCITPAYFKKGYCQCPSKDQYYKEHFGCKDRCEAENTHWNGYKCVCDRGTVSYGGKCVIPPTCKGAGSYFDQKLWKCVCHAKDEKYVDGKGCVKQCGPNEKLVWNYGQAKCVCKDGYVRNKHGKCEEKKYGQY